MTNFAFAKEKSVRRLAGVLKRSYSSVGQSTWLIIRESLVQAQVGPLLRNQALTFICRCFSFYSTELIRNFDFPIPTFHIFLTSSTSASPSVFACLTPQRRVVNRGDVRFWRKNTSAEWSIRRSLRRQIPFCVWRFFSQKAKEYPRHRTFPIGKQVENLCWLDNNRSHDSGTVKTYCHIIEWNFVILKC